MTNQLLVSVLMTVYNREKFIAEAIESVLASTYQNWELIIVDDQSKDRSVEIAKHYEAMDSRIKVYVNEQNLGDYPNRNQAASYAQGKYLKYVDADDLIYPYGLEQLIFYMEQFPDAGYGLCSLDQDKERTFPFQLSPIETYERHFFRTSIFHKAPLSSIIRRDIFEKNGGFTGKQHLGDFEMWLILSQQYPVVLMPHGIVWSREHGDQQMTDNLTNPFVPFKYLLCSEELINSINCPLDIEKRKIIFNQIQKNKSRSILSATKHHSLKKGLELFKVSSLNWLQVFKYGLITK